MNTCNFKLKYDGPALADSAIDVADLAPALLNLSEALTALNELANKNEAKISLQVKAFNQGCFVVDFALCMSILSQVGSLFTGVGVSSACNAYTLLKCVIDIVSLKRWLKGKPADKVIFSDDQKSVTIIQDDRSITVNNYTYYGWQNPKVNAACSKIVEPLRKDGIDSVTVTSGEFEEVFNEGDIEVIAKTPEDVLLTSNVSKCIVMIETAAFKDNAKWKVKIGEQTSVFASIKDEAFLDAINQGVERFGKGDVLLVELETSQSLSNGKLIVTYDIRKVLEHKTSAEQLSLF